MGEAIIDTNAARAHTFLIAQALDTATGNMDWSRHADPKHLPRSPFLHWLWQIKFTAAKNVTLHSDKMLHACGGSAYKTDLGLERYLRDGKAGTHSELCFHSNFDLSSTLHFSRLGDGAFK